MKIRFILNPTSGRNRRRPQLAAHLRDFISAHSIEADVTLTEGPGHATLLARTAALVGCTHVVAVGGDGTMNEVAQALIQTPTALVLIPCGSGNGLALHLGVPTALAPALALIVGVGGRIVPIDTGTANGHPFFNAMGLGLDADISRRFNTLTSRGLPAYLRTGLAAFRELRSERVTISNGQQQETLDVFLVAVANSDQYGNHARIAPGARVDDGSLALVAIRPVGLLGAAALAARLFSGRFDHSPHVRRLDGPHFVIDRPSRGLIHTDGETHETTARVEVCVHPRSLRIVIPATSSAATYVSAAAPGGLGLLPV